MSSNIIGFLEKRRLSIFERLPSSQKMREHDEAGKRSKKLKKLRKEHFREDWDVDLWD